MGKADWRQSQVQNPPRAPAETASFLKTSDVVYKTVIVGEYIPDLICFDQIVVDAKTIDCIGDHETGQMLHYLKITGLRLALF